MITIQQYEDAVQALSTGRRQILVRLYYIEPAKDANEIAAKLGYRGFGGANLQIGLTGKAICAHLNFKPDLSEYNPDRSEGFFIVVHRELKKAGSVFWDMEPNLRYALENLGIVTRKITEEVELLPTEISPTTAFPEGAVISVTVNRYERDRDARRIALEKHGNVCKGCEIDFRKIYGSDIPAIIEIHHINPLNLNGERHTNPETDLVPLCPNCHAVVHSLDELMTVEELRTRVIQLK